MGVYDSTNRSMIGSKKPGSKTPMNLPSFSLNACPAAFDGTLTVTSVPLSAFPVARDIRSVRSPGDERPYCRMGLSRWTH